MTDAPIVLDPGRVKRALWRQWPVIALCAAIGAVLALALAAGTHARYHATVMILLDEERSELLQLVSALPNAVINDAAVQSEMEIIRSRVLALSVVDRLNLDEDETFLNPPVDALDRIVAAVRRLARPVLDLVTGAPPPVEETAETAAMDPAQAARERAATILLSRIVVERVERSLVMRVTVIGHDPQETALIARTYGEAYTGFQLASTTEVAINAGTWIGQRLDLLEQKMIEAASAVQRFRVENGLVQVRGNLLSEQQQSEMATALVEAATEAAALRAQLDSYEALRAASAAEMASVAAQLGEDDALAPLVQLRSEYAATRRNLAAVLAQGGEEHPQVAWLRSEMTALENDIAVELEGAVAAVRTRYEIARSREAALREELSVLSASREGSAEVLGRLAQLEAIAATYAEVYADYLLRFETTAQQQGFPIASVQVISDAEVPQDPSSPRRLRMLATGMFLGGLIGIMIAALREMRDLPLRTAAEVTAVTGLPCAGLVPRGVRAGREGPVERVAARTAERLRIDIDRAPPDDGSGRIVGLAAVAGGGDIDAVVGALVRALAARAGRVLVVDAGGMRGGLPRDITRAATADLWSLGDLRARLYGPAGHATEAGALADLRADWPYVVVVLPPLTRAMVAEEMAWMLDSAILSIPWGEVAPSLVTGALADHRAFAGLVAACVLDGADLRGALRFLDPETYEARVMHA